MNRGWLDHRDHSSFSLDPLLFRSVTAMAVGALFSPTFMPAKYLSLFSTICLLQLHVLLFVCYSGNYAGWLGLQK